LTACDRASRVVALVVAALLPTACAAPGPPAPSPGAAPFAGAWTSGAHQQIAFRLDTVVITPPDRPPTPLNAAACDGTFRFGYGRESRGTLLGLPVHQPDLQRQLAAMLRAPDYSVASLTCGAGGTVYVMLDAHNLLAIHRDRDIAGIEQLRRL
jgi:hypothetical protein